MRSYIFTGTERGVIRKLFKGEVTRREHAVEVILSRVRRFKNLRSDVNLYLQLVQLAEPETAVSA